MSGALDEGRLNMTGLWEGSFSYPGFRGPTTPFVARLQESGGALVGSIMEPDTMGRSADELEATLTGMRQGRSVDFTKTYDGSGGASHAVDYVGRIADNGDRVSGVWSLADSDGTFEMWRDTNWEKVIAAVSADHVVQPAP